MNGIIRRKRREASGLYVLVEGMPVAILRQPKQGPAQPDLPILDQNVYIVGSTLQCYQAVLLGLVVPG